MNIRQYELFLKPNRESVDLRRFRAEITMAVLMYLSEAKVTVRENYYQIEIDGDISKGDVSLIGQEISRTVPELRALVKEYPSKNGKHKSSRKLFERRETVI